jgi:hypothetical protein
MQRRLIKRMKPFFKFAKDARLFVSEDLRR